MKRLFLACVFCAGSALFAERAGTLDTSFGHGKGYVTTNTGSRDLEGALGVVVQSDGKIVAVGSAITDTRNDFAFLRYKKNGDLDTSFGTNGIVKVAVGTYGSVARDALIQPDGKLVAVGMYSDIDFDHARPCAVRLLSDGTLDPDFNGTGFVRMDWIDDNSWVWGVDRQTNGALVMAGYKEVSGYTRFMVARLTSAGARDTSFNAAGAIPGIVTTAISTKSVAGDLVVQSDGKIVAVGGAGVSSVGENFVAVRYNSNGSLDTDYNETGIQMTAVPGTGAQGFPYVALLQPDGKVVSTGSISQGSVGSLFAMRYNTNGHIDTQFGVNGFTSKALTYNISDFDGAAVLQPDGTIVVGGYQVRGENTATIVLTRFTRSGALDRTFGNNGLTVTRIPNSEGAIILSLTRQTDNKLVAGGGVLSEVKRTSYDTNFLILRYRGNPAPASRVQIAKAKSEASTIGAIDYVNTAAEFYNLLVLKGGDFQNQSDGGVRCR